MACSVAVLVRQCPARLLHFKEYAPGVIISILLLIPIGVYLFSTAVCQEYVPLWYVVVPAVLILPGLAQTVWAGNVMLPQIRSMHGFGIKLSQKVYGLL